MAKRDRQFLIQAGKGRPVGGYAGGFHKRFWYLLRASLYRIFAVLFAVLVLNSCLGASADINIRANGSGTITLEYRVSQMLESLGRLDGNERWPAIPVGRADFERGLARIPGLSLKSFSTKDVRNAIGGSDLVTMVALEFRETAALLAFLDGTGSHASLSQDNGRNLLRLKLLDPLPHAVDADLISLLKENSEGYEISFSLNAPKSASLAVIPSSVPSARLVSGGNKVSFTIATGELFDLTEGLVLEFAW